MCIRDRRNDNAVVGETASSSIIDGKMVSDVLKLQQAHAIECSLTMERSLKTKEETEHAVRLYLKD